MVDRGGFLRLCFAASCLWSASLPAAPIPGLFNTGVDDTGTPLVGGNGVIDPHYVILSGPGDENYPIPAVTYFNGAYFADQPGGTNGDSRWISVNRNGSNGSSGTYDFQTTFSLTGLDPGTASITGKFAADNHITQTLINGVVVPGATSNTFAAYTDFSISSDFVSGLNTLEFIVLDDGAPMALRVDSLVGSASPQGGGGVPEPESLALLGVAFAALAISRHRKKT